MQIKVLKSCKLPDKTETVTRGLISSMLKLTRSSRTVAANLQIQQIIKILFEEMSLKLAQFLSKMFVNLYENCRFPLKIVKLITQRTRSIHLLRTLCPS